MCGLGCCFFFLFFFFLGGGVEVYIHLSLFEQTGCKKYFMICILHYFIFKISMFFVVSTDCNLQKRLLCIIIDRLLLKKYNVIWKLKHGSPRYIQ